MARTYAVAIAADDCYGYRAATIYSQVTGGGGTYYDRSDDTTNIWITRQFDTPNYVISDGFYRFDTATLPDDCTVLSATLSLYIVGKGDVDTLKLVGDWYDFGGAPSTSADWANLDAGADALEVTLASLTTSAVNTITLSNVSNISKTGITGLRLGVSKRAADAAPTGYNGIQTPPYEHATLQEARLNVQISIPGASTVPLTLSFTSGGGASGAQTLFGSATAAFSATLTTSGAATGTSGVSAKLWENGSGGAESPWASDLNGTAITVDANGRTGGTPSVVIDSNGRIACTNATNSTGAAGWGAAANFADGIIRGKVRSSHASSSDNHYATLSARQIASNGTHVSLRIGFQGGGQYTRLSYGIGDISYIAASSVTKTFVADTDYEALLYFNSTSYKTLVWETTALPPASDYKTITWDWSGTDATPTTQSGKCSLGMARFMTAQPTVSFDDVLAYAAGETVAGLIFDALTAGDAQIEIDFGPPAEVQKRAALWYFARYKATSEPTDENDGTLVTGTGDGFSGITSAGRFLDTAWTHTLTGLSNGTTYYVRPFAVMADGTIVAGTSASAAPSGSIDTTPPVVPVDFLSAYASPFVASRIDLTWTQPSEAGSYAITYRTDATYPTDYADPSAGTAVAWTGYSGGSAGTASLTSLTDGVRYMIGLWHRDAALNVSDGAFAQRVAVKQVTLETPADASANIGELPYLVWGTSAGEAEGNRPVHYKVEVSTSETSEQDFLDNSVLVSSSLDDGPTGFEYEDSAGVWVALPSSGLDPADVGKDVRYAAALTARVHYYWRVSAQQPETT